jgi:hypothetical protein
LLLLQEEGGLIVWIGEGTGWRLLLTGNGWPPLTNADQIEQKNKDYRAENNPSIFNHQESRQARQLRWIKRERRRLIEGLRVVRHTQQKEGYQILTAG